MLFRSVSQSRYVAVLDITGSGEDNVVVTANNGANTSRLLTSVGVSTSANPVSFIAADASPANSIPVGARLAVKFSSLKSQFTVLALRQAEALQRWKEISQSGDSDYREQIRKHFGVNLPQALSNMCTYIGGISRNLDISEVVNNNLASQKEFAASLHRETLRIFRLSL